MFVSCKSTEIEITKEEAVLTEANDDGPYHIQSLYLKQRTVRPDRKNHGNYLKYLSTEGTEINVACSGHLSKDSTTVFHLEASQKDKGLHAIRYDGNYYLAVDTEHQVKLCKLDSFPSEDKYFFHIKKAYPGLDAVIIQSKTGKDLYLRCGDDGELSADGTPTNVQAYFIFLPCIQEREEHEIYTKCETVTITETFEDTEDSAKGISSEHEGGASEDPNEGKSAYPVKSNSDGPGRVSSEGTGERIPEDLKSEANATPKNPERGSLKI